MDVYSLSQQGNMRHSIGFVEAPDEYDLKSGIHADGRPSEWGFDPYLGCRLHPRNKTGQHVALWESLKSEREALWAAQRIESADRENAEMEQ